MKLKYQKNKNFKPNVLNMSLIFFFFHQLFSQQMTTRGPHSTISAWGLPYITPSVSAQKARGGVDNFGDVSKYEAPPTRSSA
jgi:hypothetical protein